MGTEIKEIFKEIKEGMRIFGELISNLVNTTLLLAAYIFVIGPTAIIGKMMGKNFLGTEKEGWKEIQKDGDEKSHYRQF